MSDIKFGTDGWRAIIADEFTVENVARITLATGLWVKKNFENNLSIVIGHDWVQFPCRMSHAFAAQETTSLHSKPKPCDEETLAETMPE